MNLADLVMSAEELRAYSYARKLHPVPRLQQQQIDQMIAITIHHAFTTDEIKDWMNHMVGAIWEYDPEQEEAEYHPEWKVWMYRPDRSTEAHFYIPSMNALHVVNSRGEARKRRDAELAYVLGQLWKDRLGDQGIATTVHYYGGDPTAASKRFDDFASGVVAEVFGTIGRDSLARQKRIYVTLGPHESLSRIKHRDFSEIGEGKNDFLNYKILLVDGKIVIAFDYIFADQARNVLGKLYTHVNACFEERSEEIDVDIFHYGRIGALDPHVRVGAYCTPTAVIDEHLVHSFFHPTPLVNELVRDPGIAKFLADFLGSTPITGISVNTTSVLGERKRDLEAYLIRGCSLLDKELSVMGGIYQGYDDCYPNIGLIRYFLCETVSDVPLAHLTLANTPYPQENEERVASAYMDIIARDRPDER